MYSLTIYFINVLKLIKNIYIIVMSYFMSYTQWTQSWKLFKNEVSQNTSN